MKKQSNRATKWRLPDGDNWSFAEIACNEPERAEALEAAGSPKDLLKELERALDQAIECSDMRVGYEHSREHQTDCRTVFQFHVGTGLFDWFFNARAGYRAHFRAHPKCGIKFNDQIIKVLRGRLETRLPSVVPCREFFGDFEDRGEKQVSKEVLISSLVPYCSKVWMCTRQIDPSPETKEFAQGVVEPRIQLNEGRSWVALYRDDEAAWLDVKGAFLGDHGPYQSDPLKRANTLHDTGAV